MQEKKKLFIKLKDESKVQKQNKTSQTLQQKYREQTRKDTQNQQHKTMDGVHTKGD